MISGQYGETHTFDLSVSLDPLLVVHNGPSKIA